MPGGITVPLGRVTVLRDDQDTRIPAFFEAWRDSVPLGTHSTIDKILNCTPECGCPEDSNTAACKGNRNHGMPIELVLEHLNPEDGVCDIPGIAVLTFTTPFQIIAVPKSPLLAKIYDDLWNAGFMSALASDTPGGFEIIWVNRDLIVVNFQGTPFKEDRDPAWCKEQLELKKARMLRALQMAGHRVHGNPLALGETGFQLRVFTSPWA